MKSLFINNKEVIYTSQDGPPQQFLIVKSSSVLKSPYIEMKIKSSNKKEEIILKIRPHLVQNNPENGGSAFSCLIKVFSYRNDKHAKLEKYSRWNIYKSTK